MGADRGGRAEVAACLHRLYPSSSIGRMSDKDTLVSLRDIRSNVSDAYARILLTDTPDAVPRHRMRRNSALIRWFRLKKGLTR